MVYDYLNLLNLLNRGEEEVQVRANSEVDILSLNYKLYQSVSKLYQSVSKLYQSL